MLQVTIRFAGKAYTTNWSLDSDKKLRKKTQICHSWLTAKVTKGRKPKGKSDKRQKIQKAKVTKGIWSKRHIAQKAFGWWHMGRVANGSWQIGLAAFVSQITANVSKGKCVTGKRQYNAVFPVRAFYARTTREIFLHP